MITSSKATTTTIKQEVITMTTYFMNCKNLDELKKAYKAAAMKYHPDMGGDTATMQAINAEYEARFEVLKRSQNEQAAEDATGQTKATTESAGDFIAIVSALLKLDGLEIELCGRWLWIGGETRKHKDALKAAGCRWSSQKKLWSWHYAEDGSPLAPAEANLWHRFAASTAPPASPVAALAPMPFPLDGEGPAIRGGSIMSYEHLFQRYGSPAPRQRSG